MARLPRFDRPGAWFHVMNRGLARRSVFETEKDVRTFLARLACAVRRGELEVHAFCVMTTHYHLLVRSPCGRLSEGLRRVQNEFVRYFNRSRRRDGPLFRGRFLSKPVESVAYRGILVRYIDANPVQARLAERPWDYPHGSAARFAAGRIPRWLARDWVMAGLELLSPGNALGAYASRWGRPPTTAETGLVHARIRGPGLQEDGLDDLLAAASPQVRAWMVRKARLADATQPGVACVAPGLVMEIVEGLRRRGRRWTYLSPKQQQRDAWGIALAGLLRHLAGATYKTMAHLLGVGATMVARRLHAHRRLVEQAEYATRLGRVAALCVASAYPGQRKVRNQS